MPNEREKGYPWFFFYAGRSWLTGLGVTLFLTVLSIALYWWYVKYSNDASPDSILGYSYAIIGSTFMILAAVRYSQRRRSRKRVLGQLNAALNWHVFLGCLALVLLTLHSFGNFNPRSGTYALYALIALVISGFVGRGLDRLMPRLITSEVHKALNAQGEDRIESISQNLQAIVVHNTQELRGNIDLPTRRVTRAGDKVVATQFISPHNRNTGALQNFKPTFSSPSTSNDQALFTPWDLAYISLDELPQELQRDPSYRFIPDKKSVLTHPGALMPGTQEQLSAIQSVQAAMRREQFYRYVIRYWRIMHVGLVLLTIGLTLWHLEYAATLLIPVFFH